jgi:ubiquinone/menaquinone biosynthesis C-methylase UbiE
MNAPNVNLWSSPEHALDYLRRADCIPHRTEGEATLLEFIPPRPKRILDIGAGAGRLLALVKSAHPDAQFAGLDFSPKILETLGQLFAGDPGVTVVNHNLEYPMSPMGSFDAAISSFAIHHVIHERKRALYEEVFHLLVPGGVFCNLEHVSSPTDNLHRQFLDAMPWQSEDPSNKLLDLETQLAWLRQIGFTKVDCHWKWRELALLAGVKPIE